MFCLIGNKGVHSVVMWGTTLVESSLFLNTVQMHKQLVHLISSALKEKRLTGKI